MSIRGYTWLMIVASAALGTTVRAVPLVSEMGSDLLGWNAERRDLGENAFMDGGVPNDPIAPVSSVHGSGTAGIQITGGTAPGEGNPPVEDILYDDGGDWTGNWSSKWAANGPPLRMEFDFFADANANGTWDGWSTDGPSGLSLYIVGATTTWFYDLTGQPTAWSHHLVNLIHGAGWYDAIGGAGEDQFNSDILGTVSQIGIRIWYDQEISSQRYGLGSFTLDNEYFIIPEPQTYYSIGIAVLSLGITFRRRLNDVFATVGRLARG
jgi:hypothetical protein